MLLQRLRDLAHRNERVPEMYGPTRVRWLVRLHAQGELRDCIPLTGEGKKADQGRAMVAPTLVRASAIKPKLLCDNAEYALGIARNDADREKVAQRHAAFAAVVERCAAATGRPAAVAVQTFLASWSPARKGELPADLDGGDVVTFEVDGERPIDDPSVRRFWAAHTREGSEDVEAMQCLVCGERKTPEARHPKKIKGIPDGQTSGTSLISANSDAFESYGLAASLVSPTCRECAEDFADALNGLLANAKTRLYVGPVVHVFWTREDPTFSAFDYLDEPKPEDVKALLSAPWAGSPAADVADPDFYAAALSASGGRAVVRDYLETSISHAKARLARWFRLQSLGDDDAKPHGVFALAASVAPPGQDPDPLVTSALVRAALAGTPLPPSILGALARRNRTDRGPSRPRAALARMVLLTNPSPPHHVYTEDRLMTLELDNKDPAYLCGRLFAELAQAQWAALGDTNSTIVDRYYGTASTAPATVFGALMRGGRAHLAKLRQDKKGAQVNIERRIEEIAVHLKEFPKVLDLREQALFSLGYYHQKAAARAAKSERAAEKERNDSTSTGDDLDA